MCIDSRKNVEIKEERVIKTCLFAPNSLTQALLDVGVPYEDHDILGLLHHIPGKVTCVREGNWTVTAEYSVTANTLVEALSLVVIQIKENL